MRGVGGVAAAAVLAAVLGVAVEPGPAVGEQAGDDGARFLLFAVSDLWRQGGFLHGGAVWSPAGIDRDGFALKVMTGGGEYRYRSGALGNAEVTGRVIAATILPGWRFRRDSLIVTVFAGLDYQDHRLSPDDPSAGLRGSYFGARTTIEAWYEPTTATMIAADATVSTIGPSYSARAAFGWKLFERFYVGPEVKGFAVDSNYRQFRAGMHVTAIKVGWSEWSAGAGWTIDSDSRDGFYGSLGVIVRR
jgi:hypothetical protein